MSTSDKINDALLREIEAAQKCHENPPPNESCTCDWIILPLLRTVGYARWEIVSQAGTPGGGYPDYTILPNTPYTWYLEAKEWKRNLDNRQDVIQALSYANSQGHRWVVLSNGRQWLLFDNHIQGVGAEQRLVARADVDSSAFIEFMLALSKSSIQAGGLDEYAVRSRLRTVLQRELVEKDSPIVRSICNILRNKFGFLSIQTPDVAAYFNQMQTMQAPVHPDKSIAIGRNYESTSQTEGALNFEKLRSLGRKVWNNSPDAIIFPDGSQISVHRWVDMALEVVKWLAVRDKLPPLPFSGASIVFPGYRRWFLSNTPVHESGKQMRSKTLEAAGQQIHMNADNSSSDFVWYLCALCEAVGEAPSNFLIKLEKPIG